MVRLQVEHLARRYGRRVVFSGLSFEVEPGRVLVVTGPNGSGKSTLLRCLAGLERPSGGTVGWLQDGLEWTRDDRRRRLGYVSPELALYEELTGLENLRFFTRLRHGRSPGAEPEALLGQVGLGARGHERVRAYSSGMRQRLKWALALQGRPDALLLDEPGVTLDAEGFDLARHLIEQARERQGTVVVATNDTREMELGDARIELG